MTFRLGRRLFGVRFIVCHTFGKRRRGISFKLVLTSETLTNI